MPRAPKVVKSNGGRSLITIDWKRVDNLLKSGCNGVQVAAFLGMHRETFYDRVALEKGVSFSDYIASKKSEGDALLHEKQYELSMKGNTQLLLRLGEFRLGQGKQAESDPSDVRNAVIIENEVKKRVAAELLSRGITMPEMENRQSVFDQRLPGKQDPLQNELGSEASLRECEPL